MRLTSQFQTSFHDLRQLPHMLLVALAMILALGADTAKADKDCTSVSAGTCLDHSLSMHPDGRYWSAYAYIPTESHMDGWNLKIPGYGQQWLKRKETVVLVVPENGAAQFSMQACHYIDFTSGTTCKPWAVVSRTFASRAACDQYANEAAAAVVEQQKLGCGFGGPRWDTSSKAHFEACFLNPADWQGMITNETNLRNNDLAICKQRIAAVEQANKPKDRPIKATGRPKDGSGGGGKGRGLEVLVCKGGGGMEPSIKDTSAFVTFSPALVAASDAEPGAGQCGWLGRKMALDESKRFAFSIDKPYGPGLLDAIATGKTFRLKATSMGQFIMVNSFEASVEVVAAAVDPDIGDDADEPADAAVDDDDDGQCIAGAATVSIEDDSLTKLNVRERPNGKIRGSVKEGKTVEVIGQCGAEAAVGFAKKNAADGWCQIDSPVAGCVKAEFLDFGGGVGGAGFAKSKKAAPIVAARKSDQKEAGSGVAFSGNWTAEASGVEYDMNMTQKGSSVSGDFKGDDGSRGEFSGKLKGDVLSFSFKQRDGLKGTGKFKLSGDGSSFDGSYNIDGSRGSWSGSRN